MTDVLIENRRFSVQTGRWLGKGGRIAHTVYPVKFMVVTGELTTGFEFYGLFDTVDKAEKWAATSIKVGTVFRIHNMSDVRNDGA